MFPRFWMCVFMCFGREEMNYRGKWSRYWPSALQQTCQKSRVWGPGLQNWGPPNASDLTMWQRNTHKDRSFVESSNNIPTNWTSMRNRTSYIRMNAPDFLVYWSATEITSNSFNLPLTCVGFNLTYIGFCYSEFNCVLMPPPPLSATALKH